MCFIHDRNVDQKYSIAIFGHQSVFGQKSTNLAKNKNAIFGVKIEILTENLAPIRNFDLELKCWFKITEKWKIKVEIFGQQPQLTVIFNFQLLLQPVLYSVKLSDIYPVLTLRCPLGFHQHIFVLLNSKSIATRRGLSTKRIANLDWSLNSRKLKLTTRQLASNYLMSCCNELRFGSLIYHRRRTL